MVSHVISHLKQTAQQSLKLWPVSLDSIHLVSFSDALGIPSHETEGAWILLAGEMKQSYMNKLSPLIMYGDMESCRERYLPP